MPSGRECGVGRLQRLTVAAELPWREIVILRAIAKFLRQAGLMLSQTYVENAVVKYPAIAIMLVSSSAACTRRASLRPPRHAQAPRAAS